MRVTVLTFRGFPFPMGMCKGNTVGVLGKQHNAWFLVKFESLRQQSAG